MPIIAPHDLGSYCLFAGFIGGAPCFAAAGGAICAPAWGKTIQAAEGGLTAVAASAAADCLLLGSEDGAVRRLSAGSGGAPPALELLAQTNGKWIDYLAAAPQDGGFAFSCGRKLYYGAANGKKRGKAGQTALCPLQEFTLERSVEGLDFAAKGLRLAAARYNGVSLYRPGTESEPVKLEWKGAHIGVAFSPDRRYVITAMQENALHGWRLEDGQHLRMSGYPAKVKSLSWSANGRYLATSGAPAAILWPFSGKEGPMNKAPLELGARSGVMVSCVSCHPRAEMAAIGYADGMILAAPFAGGGEAALRRGGRGQITAMGWDKEGTSLAFGAESGEAGLISLRG